MEFSEKLQQLRKQNNLTQEQLAEQLYVSRTAISKWESGKGYPNIDSLKSVSKLFSVSIDDLLSGEELISLAEDENRSNISKTFNLVFGILDLLMLMFLFLPLYGQQEGEFVRAVNLFAIQDVSAITYTIYFALPILIALLGILEIAVQYDDNNNWLKISKICSVFFQAIAILAFILTRQPYATSLLFIFFLIKIVLLIKNSKLQ